MDGAAGDNQQGLADEGGYGEPPDAGVDGTGQAGCQAPGQLGKA